MFLSRLLYCRQRISGLLFVPVGGSPHMKRRLLLICDNNIAVCPRVSI